MQHEQNSFEASEAAYIVKLLAECCRDSRERSVTLREGEKKRLGSVGNAN